MSVGQTSPFESNQDDPKMSDPSTPPPVSSEAPLESSEDEPSAGPSSLLVALILGLFKLVAVGLLVYLTYFFTMTFANRTPPAAPLSEEQKVLAKKAEDLRNQGKTLLSSYGWVNPATKSNVRIPIERAMELIAAEAAQPPAPAVVAAPAAGPGPAATTTTAAAARPGRRPVQRQRRLQPSRQLRCPRQPRRLRPACPPSRCIAPSAWPVTTRTAGARSSAWPCRPFLTSPTPSGKPRARTPSCSTRSSRGKTRSSTGSSSRSCCP